MITLKYYLSDDVLRRFQRINVAAVIIKADEGILLCQRSKNKNYLPGFWHLPGGKVEQGETFHEALVREVKEELSLTVKDSFLLSSAFVYGSTNGLHCTYFLIAQACDRIKLDQENESFDFFQLDDIHKYVNEAACDPTMAAVKEALTIVADRKLYYAEN